jgi:hypothetical protein
MRFWFSGPRLFSGLVRPGISFGPEDLRARRVKATRRERAMKVERQRPVRSTSAYFLALGIIVAPIAIFVIGVVGCIAILLRG